MFGQIFCGVFDPMSGLILETIRPLFFAEGPTKKADALKEIGDRVMCRIGALLPDEFHGVYRGHSFIEKFRLQNKL